MEVLKYVFLGLLIICSVIHLYHSYIDDAKKRAITKPFLLIFILLYYLCAAGGNYSFFLIIALATSWLGDVLLIKKGDFWFSMGGMAFIASHLSFILLYYTQTGFADINYALVIPIALIYCTISVIIITRVGANVPKVMLCLMCFYLLCNSAMNVFALIQLTEAPGKATAVAYVGAVLFFISDCLLFLVRYYKKKDLIYKKHFFVMLTYILGEFMITLGTLMLHG